MRARRPCPGPHRQDQPGLDSRVQGVGLVHDHLTVDEVPRPSVLGHRQFHELLGGHGSMNSWAVMVCAKGIAVIIILLRWDRHAR